MNWYWHIHHDVICEPLTEPLENRLDYIRTQKPEAERETRLRLIAPVTVALPDDLAKARAASDKARAASAKAWTAYAKARAASDKAWTAYDKARAASDKARAAYAKVRAASAKVRAASAKARAAYDKAWAASDKAWAAHAQGWVAAQPELERLHALDCPAAVAGTCTWDGKSIFPEAT